MLESGPLLGIVRFQDGGDVLGAIDARPGRDRARRGDDRHPGCSRRGRAGGGGRAGRWGVGTVVSPEQVRACAAAGARFVVSPGLLVDVIESARSLGLEPVPGVFTATEILAATAAGARVMKLFPASCGGPSYLRALRGPFPTTQLVPTAASGSTRSMRTSTPARPWWRSAAISSGAQRRPRIPSWSGSPLRPRGRRRPRAGRRRRCTSLDAPPGAQSPAARRADATAPSTSSVSRAGTSSSSGSLSP